MTRRLIIIAVLLAGGASSPSSARADHALEFYPSYYPHEIRIQAVDPAAAARLFARNALHAYVGADPYAGRAAPAGLGHAESLGSYLVATFATPKGAPGDRATRCARVGTLLGALARSKGAYAFHPYPVTPFHMDYLHHVDLAESARGRYEPRSDASAPPVTLRVRTKGKLAEALVPSAWRAAGQAWDATLEEIDVQELVSAARSSLDGWLGPPWVKEGWFHAFLLQAGTMAEGVAKRKVDAIYRRLVTGVYDGEAERLNLERTLLSLLLAGCERVVVGYTVKREYFNNSDYSEGIENVAYDSQSGFNSPIFIRTVKLKDFLWNGWLRLGVGSTPRAAWNPVGGFTDPAGRLIWSAVGDPALFPAPHSGSWLANRVTMDITAEPSPSERVAIPKDALIPELGTGVARPVGAGKTAKTKIVYRVLASSFHDKTAMSAADVLYPLTFAFRWGARHPQKRDEYDPVIDASTALLREWLAGVKPLRVEQGVRDLGGAKYPFQVQVLEAYLHHTLADPRQVASVAPPWSSLPWHLIVLMEEAVKRGVAAFSAEEAKRRGVPWLDLVRDQAVKERLAALVEGFARQGYVPPALKDAVTTDEARARWTALKGFYDAHRHFLVTNGPYRLHQWSGDSVVLQAFRDATYPVGLGLFNQYPIPRRAYVSTLEVRGNRLEIRAEVERVFTFQRTFKIGREPLLGQASTVDPWDIPLCRYVVVGRDGTVVHVGTAPYGGGGVFAVDLKGTLKPGLYTILAALYLGGNFVNPDVKLVPYRPEGPA